MRKLIDILTEATELTEMPMQAVTQLGNWDKNSGFNAQDRKLLNNPKAVKKIQSMWKYPEEVDYNVVLVNNSEARSFQEVGLIGKAGLGRTENGAAEIWLNANMPKNAPDIIPLLRSDQVNIIFTNNTGAQRVPMTGWIMAHRFGHAIFRMGKSHYYTDAANTLSRYLGDLAEQYGIQLNGTAYGSRDDTNALMSTTTRNLMGAICTFKSARDGKLRNTFEALHELFAQYITTGRLTFNNIPHSVKVGARTFTYRGGDDYDYDNGVIQDDLSYELQQFLETAIHYAVGGVFVM